MSRPLTAYQRKREEALWLRVHRAEALTAQQGRCAYCRSFLPRRLATADHVTARSKGGLNGADNIKAACAGCNTAKGSKQEKNFTKLISNRKHALDTPFYQVHYAWMRLRLSKRIEAAERRILASVGLQPDGTKDSPAHVAEGRTVVTLAPNVSRH